jgi:hypothetical protein
MRNERTAARIFDEITRYHDSYESTAAKLFPLVSALWHTGIDLAGYRPGASERRGSISRADDFAEDREIFARIKRLTVETRSALAGIALRKIAEEDARREADLY